MMNCGRFIEKEVGSDLICYDTDKDEIHVLNSTALAIHRLLCAGKTEGQIIEELQTSSHLPEGHKIEADVRACIETLAEKGLVDTRQFR